MFLTSTLPALTSLLCITWSWLAALSSSYRDASRPPCLMWANAFSRAGTACEHLLFCTFLCLVYPPPLLCHTPFQSSKRLCPHFPWEVFCQYSFPLSNLIIFLLLFFISLFLSFPLSYDISRADTQCCYPRVQHGAHLWIGLKFFFFFLIFCIGVYLLYNFMLFSAV